MKKTTIVNNDNSNINSSSSSNTMPSIKQKIRDVFSWKHDTYTFDEDDNNVKKQKKDQNLIGKNSGAISKATTKRIQHGAVARNPSLASTQLNAIAPLVRITRLPSNRSTTDTERDIPLRHHKPTVSKIQKSSALSVTTKKVQQQQQQQEYIKPSSSFEDIRNKTKNFFIKPKTAPPANSRPNNINNSTTPAKSITQNLPHPKESHLGNQKYTKNTNQRFTTATTSSTTTTTASSLSSTTTSKSISVTRQDDNKYNRNPVTTTSASHSKFIITEAKRSPGGFFGSLSPKRRGQGPSGGSKHTGPSSSVSGTSSSGGGGGNTTNSNNILNTASHHNNNNLHNNQIRGSSSISSLDGIGIQTAFKSTSKHNNNHKLSSSKESLDGGGSGSGGSGKISKADRRRQREQQRNLQTSAAATGAAATALTSKEYNNINYAIGNYATSETTSTTSTLNKELNFDGTKEDPRVQNKMQELQNHLDRLTLDKMALETKIAELSTYQNEVINLRSEVTKLQINQDMNNSELHKLSEENESLKNRLRNVVHSPLSDTEKQQIINDTQRLHNSAPASIALPNVMSTMNHDVDGTPCVTPDWDKHSSSSEISVACLQDKIIQMEETHYSTNEELQATLQELADLQSQLSELQADNDRLAEEKEVLFQSLCTQTEKLEDSRSKIGTLNELLLHDTNPKELGTTTEREQKLVDLLKSAHDERENVLLKQEELSSELNEVRTVLDSVLNEKKVLKERISVLESTLDANIAERKQIDMQLQQSNEESASHQIEISRLKTLLENARSKIDDYEQDRALDRDKSDFDELLDNARKEKDILEGSVASLQELLSKSKCEVQKLKDQISGITEECKVTRNNAKYALSDLQYKYDVVQQEKQKLSSDYQTLQDNINELQIQCKCHVEDKAQLENLLSETQKHLGEAERFSAEIEHKLSDEKILRKQESDEWKQFQSDLLMTVRVANDFKTEAQLAYEQLVMDNKAQRDKIRFLEQDITKLNKALQDAHASILNSVVQQEMAVRRQRVAISRQDSRLSVKSLIESIEKSQQTKSNGSGGSRCSSTSSLNSLTSDATSPSNNVQQNGRQNDWNDNNNNNNVTTNQLEVPVVTSYSMKSPLREQQPQQQQQQHSPQQQQSSQLQQQTIGSNLSINSNHKGILSDYGKNETTTLMLNNNNYHQLGKIFKQVADDPCVTSILSQKSMDFVRRNSYGDLSDRKDPLNALVKNGGSKRNALLKWCQNKTVGYRNIDITNFSSSWNDGLALCAILHTYLPDRIPYDTLGPNDKRQNFSIAFSAAESVGIQTSLNINDMCQLERPDWQQVMAYVTVIYKHFET